MNETVKEYLLWLKTGDSNFLDYEKFFGRMLTPGEVEDIDNTVDEHAGEMTKAELMRLAEEWKEKGGEEL